jgi:hypothetical protein
MALLGIMIKLVDQLGTRNRNSNVPIVGTAAAVYTARSVILGSVVAVGVIVWMVVYAVATFSDAAGVAAASLLILLILGIPIAFAAIRYSTIAARLAADYLSTSLGFRPKWWMCYSSPPGWNNAIDRQRRWHQTGRWPMIPW